jgi:hypothetical protein
MPFYEFTCTKCGKNVRGARPSRAGRIRGDEPRLRSPETGLPGRPPERPDPVQVLYRQGTPAALDCTVGR